MNEKYPEIAERALDSMLDMMCTAARTAPKTRGRDMLVITTVSPEERTRLIAKMNELSDLTGRASLARDASCIDATGHILLIGVRNTPQELDCGFCGHESCSSLKRSGGVCAFNSMDLGIALGSAASLAARWHIDNRMMYSVGKAALELKLLGENIAQAIGLPLSATGKNPFFDRT